MIRSTDVSSKEAACVAPSEELPEKGLIQLQLRLSVSLAQTTDIEDGLNTGLGFALQSSGMDCGQICLSGSCGNRTHLCVSHGMGDTFCQCPALYEKKPDKTKCIPSCNTCPDGPRAELAKVFQSFITIPIFARKKILGWMTLASHSDQTIPLTIRTHLKTIAALLGNTIWRIQIQNELQENKDNMSSILESTPGFVVYRLVIDEGRPYKLRQTHVSPSIKPILGYDPDKWQVENYYENIHPDDQQLVTEAHQTAFKTNRFEATARVYNPNTEKYVWIHAISVAVLNSNAQITHFNGLMIDRSETRNAQMELVKNEKYLEMKTEELNRLNTTLRTLLEKRDQDRMEMEQSLVLNIKELILPFIEKIHHTSSPEKQAKLLDIVEMNLNDIASEFVHVMSTKQLGLSPTEMKVATCIKMGKSTKEIAELLGTSEKTVKNQRFIIRKKLGINKKKINLQTYLTSLQLRAQIS